jgi:hypothetical protein
MTTAQESPGTGVIRATATTGMTTTTVATTSALMGNVGTGVERSI